MNAFEPYLRMEKGLFCTVQALTERFLLPGADRDLPQQL